MKQVLIADDDAVSRLLMQRMLRQSGFEVSTATNGTEAVECLTREDGPRLVLLDWTMPELNGLEVCRAVRASGRRAYVYITLLTSKDSKEDVVAGFEAGADDYLTKPCHPEEIKARLRAAHRILQLEDYLVDAREEMRFRANHDSLTRLLNRGAIFETLSLKLNNTVPNATPTGLVLCDVDRFKQINDTYGHPVGDEVLREVALRLQRGTRKGDVGRYGGEEFMILLEDCSQLELGALAERVCHSVRETPIITAAGPLSVTVSAGAVSLPMRPNALSPEQIIREVDSCLYQAKQNGRNRVVLGSCEEKTIHLLCSA